MSRIFLAFVLPVFVLSACVKQDSPDSAIDDVSDPTGVTSVDAVQAAVDTRSGEGARQHSVESGESIEEASGENVAAGESKPPSLNLKPPQSTESSEHLFSGGDSEPNYFTSNKGKEERDSVRLKGKLYMIEEPVPEKRIQNVDGGEVGIIVPLR